MKSNLFGGIQLIPGVGWVEGGGTTNGALAGESDVMMISGLGQAAKPQFQQSQSFVTVEEAKEAAGAAGVFITKVPPIAWLLGGVVIALLILSVMKKRT